MRRDERTDRERVVFDEGDDFAVDRGVFVDRDIDSF